ncbi:ABC transporter permease [Bifidobacterium margollesii]|uniref:ABC transporter permease n=1 Tax=Bifidobacterium margollesii TaxID=2020964 RepID=A0A2N5JBE5_9BIFI|nr:ABC transporter permease [Bifidobacterium margollesii]PLS31524.1 ABC transporter permease [Bifidobacterium margollesii]
MNVYLFEVKAQMRGFLVGLIVLIGVAVLFLGGAYPIYRDSKTDVERMIDGFPPQFAALFGVNGDIFSFGGFYRFSSLYFMLIMAIMSCAWGLSVLGRERRSKAGDFLFVMPSPRIRLYLAKLAAGLTLVVVSGLLYLVAVALIYGHYGDDPTATSIPLSRLLLAAASLLGVGVLFLSFGVLAAVLLNRIRSVSGIATAFGVLGFMLVSLPEMTGETKYRLISPFTWFNVSEALDHGRYEAGYLTLAAVVAVACLACGAVLYARGDVRGLR